MPTEYEMSSHRKVKRLDFMVNPGYLIVGFIILLIVVGVLLYIFYSRTNAVEKTGFGALIMLALVSLMIPVFWIMESGNQSTAQANQQDISVQRGLALYAQYCVQDCYQIQGGKVVNPTYNGYTISALNQLNDNDLMRVIYAGIYNPSAPPPANVSLVPKSQDYAGPLDSNDVGYLFSFIRSATKTGSANGFNQLVSYLQTNDPAAYATASAPKTSQFGNAVDMTGQKAITLNIIDSPSGATCIPACFSPLNVKVKVGTVITWVNKSKTIHTVTAINGTTLSAPTPNSKIFDSGISNGIKTGGTFKWTVTMAAYNYDSTNHVIFYYCQYHQTMLAELTIVQ